MKTVFNFLLLCCIALQLRAQTDTAIYVDPFDTAAFPILYDTTPYPAPYESRFLENMADTCPSAVVSLAPVIHYANETKAYLEFSEHVSQIRIQQVGASTYTTVTVNGQSILIQYLQPDVEYEVLTQTACGNFELAGTIDTRTGEQETLNVSPQLYKAIRYFQESAQGEGEAIPFNTFLTQRADVAFFEKVYFIQQYFLHGEPINAFSETQLPYYLPPTVCNCKFVFNLSEFAVPGEQVELTNANNLTGGSISSDIRFAPKRHISGNDDTNTWWNRNTKGAAKWHQLWTEGSKAGGADRKIEMRMADSTTTVGTQYGALRYNLFCTNFEQVPSDCQCEKGIRLYWAYDTEACARAERHSEGWGGKNAVASAEDIASVVFTREDGSNSPAVIDGGVARARAECERKVNAEFWANAASVALRVAGVVYGISAGDTLSPSQQQIFNFGLQGLENSIRTLIQTPYYSSNFCNETNCIEKRLCWGDTLVYLKPNEPVNLYVFSNTSLMAGGKRSWFSWGRVLSNFYLAGYVPGGYTSEEQTHCCTKKYANWVLASELGAPHSTDDLKNEVSFILSAWNPWPALPTGPLQVLIPFEYGSTSVPVVDCPDGGAIIGGNGDERELKQAENQPIGLDNKVYTISVFDLSGRSLFEEKSFELPIDWRNFLADHWFTPPAQGIYIIHAISASDSKTIKIFLD